MEDSSDDVFFVKRAWERNGQPYRLVHVSNGDEARAYLSAEGKYAELAGHPPPKLIVSDLKMPRWDGMQLLRWVRSHGQLGALPFVMLSSSPREDDIAAALSSGASAYFVKPRTLPGFVQLLVELQRFWVPASPET